jgi:YebC/PmpR family DNA-binding regulatory protein
MAKHSHFDNIKRSKALVDAQRGKVFTVHARLIAIAARAGGDPVMNAALKSAIDRAKAANVPNANIERAIKKGTGEDKEGTVLEEGTYEALGPSGVVFMVDVITDNKNRALTNIRTILTKNGGNLGSSGSVAWKFDKKAYFLVDPAGQSADEAELALIDCGADDLEADEGKYEVYASPEKLGEMRKALAAAGFKVEKDELVWLPKDKLMISDLDTAKTVLKLMELLDEDEDVMRVTTNAEVSDELSAQLG